MYDAMVPHRQPVSGVVCWRTVIAVGAALIIAACATDGAAPTAPTPKTPSVASVAVTGSALPLGATAQFIATATLSDGSTQNVTTAATWASSNQSVASVTSTGIVNAQAPGDADIAATYNGVSGKAHVSLVRPPALVAVISGTIRDAYSGGILPNISVALVGSHSAIKSTRTDATGTYSVANIATGPVAVSFSATSYVTLTKTVAVSEDTRIDVTLERDGPISGPALLTIHAPYVYRGSAPNDCGPSAAGADFTISGTQTVDDQHLTFTAGPDHFLNPVLAVKLTKTGRQLAGEIGGATLAVISPKYGYEVQITDLMYVDGLPAATKGAIGAGGGASGTMIGTLRGSQFPYNPLFWCSGTFQWALTNQ